jgi:hypothetical protein
MVNDPNEIVWPDNKGAPPRENVADGKPTPCPDAPLDETVVVPFEAVSAGTLAKVTPGGKVTTKTVPTGIVVVAAKVKFLFAGTVTRPLLARTDTTL